MIKMQYNRDFFSMLHVNLYLESQRNYPQSLMPKILLILFFPIVPFKYYFLLYL